MNEQQTNAVNENGQTEEEAQAMLQAQIAYTVSELAVAVQALELDGVHPSALTTGMMAMFIQLLCASSLLANREQADVEKALEDAVFFGKKYVTEVYTTMKESMAKQEVSNAAI